MATNKSDPSQLGWIIGKPLSLLFDPFESVTLFLAVLLANCAYRLLPFVHTCTDSAPDLVNSGQTPLPTEPAIGLKVRMNRLSLSQKDGQLLTPVWSKSGYLLMMTYLIIAVAFWYYPSGQFTSSNRNTNFFTLTSVATRSLPLAPP